MELDPITQALDTWSTFFVHPRNQTVTVYPAMIEKLLDIITQEIPNTGDQLHDMVPALARLRDSAPVKLDQNSIINRKLLASFLEYHDYYGPIGRKLLMKLLLQVRLI